MEIRKDFPGRRKAEIPATSRSSDPLTFLKVLVSETEPAALAVVGG